jgi:hypothetical protein
LIGGLLFLPQAENSPQGIFTTALIEALNEGQDLYRLDAAALPAVLEEVMQELERQLPVSSATALTAQEVNSVFRLFPDFEEVEALMTREVLMDIFALPMVGALTAYMVEEALPGSSAREAILMLTLLQIFGGQEAVRQVVGDSLPHIQFYDTLDSLVEEGFSRDLLGLAGPQRFEHLGRGLAQALIGFDITLDGIMPPPGPQPAPTVPIGSVIGEVLKTDIVAYINGHAIPSYNINGDTAIVAEDLINYGFDVYWDGAARELRIRRTPNQAFSPLPATAASPWDVGTKAFDVLATDIKTFIVVGQTEILLESFNINGFTAIYVDSLAAVFGTAAWLPLERELRVQLDN